MEIISKANEKYCWCFKDVEKHISSSPMVQENECLNSDISSLGSFEIDPRTEVRRRKKRSSALEIENWIEEIYKLMINGSLKFIVGKTKSKSPYYDSPRPRSSKFIGVSKNGENWQVLINCKKSKRYIGTFYSEIEAAISYDFYSICLHNLTAKTNFTYDSKLIKNMIECYDAKRKRFWVSKFINRP